MYGSLRYVEKLKKVWMEFIFQSGKILYGSLLFLSCFCLEIKIIENSNKQFKLWNNLHMMSIISRTRLRNHYLPMYLRDFDDEPSLGNLQFSTYLLIIKRKKHHPNSMVKPPAKQERLLNWILRTWRLDHPNSLHFLHSQNRSFLSSESVKEIK